MSFAVQRFFNRRSAIAHRPWCLLLLLILPLTACGRHNARQALRKTQFFAEILQRESRREIGEDGFFRDNLVGNRDLEVRRWCAIALGRIADPRALPILYGALHAGDAEVRAASAFAIGEIEGSEPVHARSSASDPRAVAELFRLLDDPSISVRIRAIEALGKIGSRTEAADIVRRMERLTYGGSPFEKNFLNAAIVAIARLGNPVAIPFLERLSVIRDPEIQQGAAEAIRRIQAQVSDHPSANRPPLTNGEAGTAVTPEMESGIVRVTGLRSEALAAFRRNSTIAQIETTRGTIEVELFREDAPITAEAFAEMALRGIYNDTELSVTAPSQIVEGGNPVDWPGLRRAVQSEINMRPFERGRIGMEVSGGSSDAGRFFITLVPQPYLDGQKTCFGHVVSGMQIADKLSPGDRILRVTIKETVHYHDYQRY